MSAAGRRGRIGGAVRSVADPRLYAHALRLLHFYGYSHVQQRARLTRGPGVRMAPNVSLRNAERIRIGAGAHIGERCSLWAGDTAGSITIGEHALFGPEVFVTASDYATAPGIPVMHQPKIEADVTIGSDVWLGVRVIVVAGVSIGDGAVVGAGSIVTRDLPPGCVAVGSPARVVGWRDDREHDSRERDVREREVRERDVRDPDADRTAGAGDA